ncbi:MAG: hypothetical protein ACMG55_11850, partial [Microcoleus sp.]
NTDRAQAACVSLLFMVSEAEAPASCFLLLASCFFFFLLPSSFFFLLPSSSFYLLLTSRDFAPKTKPPRRRGLK